ncbi:MAG: hypothetical protein EU550_01060 [Promethearchaeota archaeon]|nr:MAG: hypothetical protein EU550_01060 [Candidatus Lokiarchaeota archaeon]
MENFKEILRDFYQTKSELIEEYYKSVLSYLKDLYSYKKIDLNIRVNDLSKKGQNETSETILKITRIGLNTLGISKKKLFELKNRNAFIQNGDDPKVLNYNDFLNKTVYPKITKTLFTVIIDYVYNGNDEIIKNLNQFNLIPTKLLSDIHKLRKNEKLQKSYQKINLNELHLQDISIDFKPNPDKLGFRKQSLRDKVNIKKSTVEIEFIKELESAIRSNIMTLKQDIKNSISTDSQDEEIIKNKKRESPVTLNCTKKIPFFIDNLPIFSSKEKLINTSISLETLLDDFGDLFNVEILYYLVSIFHMLGLRNNLDLNKIFKVINNQIKSGLFVSDSFDSMDLDTNFYGLALVFYLNESEISNQIDFYKIKKIIENYLENISYGNIKQFYTSLLLANIIKLKIPGRSHDRYLSLLKDFDFEHLMGENFINNIFYYIFSFSLLDCQLNMEVKLMITLEDLLYQDLIKNMSQNSLKDYSITQLSRLLLILQELDRSQRYKELEQDLHDYILKSSNFFEYQEDIPYSWNVSKLMFLTELKTLFWTLLIRSFQF